MATKHRPGWLRVPAGVQQWRAETARRAARAGIRPGRDRRFRWPDDREAIVAETMAAARCGPAK